ncbi:MAG: hypothetical protein WAK94_10905 [Steroidobacteraceae bacterium]
MQVTQGVRRDAWRPERHRGTNPGVEHPLRQRRYDSRFNLNVDDAAASALLAVVRSDALAVEWMPRVVNINFPPDMGRMTA